MTTYRTLAEVTIEYFTQHPEEIDLFLQKILADDVPEDNAVALLSALRRIAPVQGLSPTPRLESPPNDG